MENDLRRPFFFGLWNWLLATSVAVGAVGCMVSGLYLVPDRPFVLFLAWALTSFVCALCCRWRWGPWAIAGTLVCAAVLFFLDGSIQTFLLRVSMLYDRVYGCGILIFENYDPFVNPSLDIALGLIGCICAAVCALCCNTRGGSMICLPICLLPLIPCMTLPYAGPDTSHLFLLLTTLLLILFTDLIRQRSRKDSLRLGALLLVPSILFVWLSASTADSASRRRQLLSMQHNILNAMDRLNASVTGNLGTQPPVDNRLYIEVTDLSALGPQTLRITPVMQLTSTFGGTIYLRGQAYDVYDGKSWSISQQPYSLDLGWPRKSELQELGSVSISTTKIQPLRFFPYYPARTIYRDEFREGHMVNFNSLRYYTFKVGTLSNSMVKPSKDPNGDYKYCLDLPDDTRDEAVKYLRRLNLTQSTRRSLAQQICNAVSESAQYDLRTQQMPASYDDFAMWFLEESDTGYCVHYATAAVVLLRAAGIPARYVTGYAVQITGAGSVTVTEAHAHAWVEYYDDATQCWQSLEPTPATEGSTNPTVTPLTPNLPDVTDPPDTETTPPATENTDPPQTQPPADTQPQQTQPPAAVTEDTKPQFPWRLLSVPVCGALLAIQYFLRRRLRKKRLSSGSPNARTLALWRQVLRYDRALGRRHPKQLLELAEKARFSQHSITDAELQQFIDYLSEAAAALKKLPLCPRIFWRLVLAIK